MNSPLSIQMETVVQSRDIERLVEGVATSDGAGVKLTRVLSQPLQQRLDPYLMLDAFGSDQPDDYIAGFPDHPHRGFETITYMIAGRMLHRDSAGHEGLLESGGVQWMVAGRGVIHSEIPQQEEGLMQGFQLWLNLPAADKMAEPWYRDIPAEELPSFVTPENVTARVIAGRSHGIDGAVQRPVTEPLYLDLYFSHASRFLQSLPSEHNAFLYVYEGDVQVNGRTVKAGRMGILSNHPDADGVVIEGQAGTRALLIAGKPLKERIVQYGPFVMNSEAEIHPAFSDYQAGHFSGAIAGRDT
ncbi:pirin family protein [Achromobacter sp. F4_2707]|uniref:pirin family protein n=1 Tax=Achromobacter sp. F4_2707 TaxID=3114286 RepID=UPI0039C67DA9